MSEIDERMQNWRTDRIAEYARLENEITLEMNELRSDPELVKLMTEQAKLNDMVALAKGMYAKNIEAFQQQQAGIKLELIDSWGNAEEKTFKCGAGSATLRTTRSLYIRNKEKLVEFLAILGKLPEFIKTFETAKLRKIKDAGLLEDEIATWDEKKNMVIKIAEADQ